MADRVRSDARSSTRSRDSDYPPRVAKKPKRRRRPARAGRDKARESPATNREERRDSSPIRREAPVDSKSSASSRRLWIGAVVVAAAGALWLATRPDAPPSYEELRVEVVREIPHARDAFTQGLLFHDGALYESTGRVGQSSVREVDPQTGEVRRRREVPDVFGEGLALVGDLLFQLTWQDGRALVYRRGDFEPVREHEYSGEGWGLCWDGQRLVMSDGSEMLTFRRPDDFDVIGVVRVTDRGRPLRRLNELECVDGAVYANVWTTDRIVRIDPTSGRVTASIDASGLLSDEERLGVDVLNGIAWLPDRRRLLITGKLWPKMFEVDLVPATPGPEP